MDGQRVTHHSISMKFRLAEGQHMTPEAIDYHAAAIGYIIANPRRCVEREREPGEEWWIADVVLSPTDRHRDND